jgi:hypothetical protein
VAGSDGLEQDAAVCRSPSRSPTRVDAAACTSGQSRLGSERPTPRMSIR